MKYLLFKPYNFKNQTKFVWHDILDTANQQKEKLKSYTNKETKRELSKFSAGMNVTIDSFQSQEKLEEEIKIQLEAKEKLSKLQALINTKLETTYKGFVDRTIEKISAIGTNTNDKARAVQEEKDKFFAAIQGDKDIDFSINKYLEFGRVHKHVLFGMVASNFLIPDKEARISGKSMGWTMLAMQPFAAKVATGIAKGVPPVLKKIIDVPRNLTAGIVNGQLYKEFFGMAGDNGDPIEYIWNGKTKETREREKIKDPEMLKDLSKMKEVMGAEFKEFYNANKEYEKNPERMQRLIPNLALFSARALKSKLNDDEAINVIKKMNNNEWDDIAIKKAFTTAHLGAITMFMDKKASAKDFKTFKDELNKQWENKETKSFNNYDIQTFFPGINEEKMTSEQKTNILKPFGSLSKMLAITYFGSMVLSKFFGPSGWVIRASELSSQGPKILAKPFKWAGRGVKKLLHPFKSIKELFGLTKESKKPRAFNSYINALYKGKTGNNVSILSAAEHKKLRKLSKKEKIKIFNSAKQQFGEDSKEITAKEFWSLEGVKDLNIQDNLN